MRAMRFATSGGLLLPSIVNLPTGPWAAGSTPIYTAQIVDQSGEGIPADDLASLTLSIVDTLSGAVVNGVSSTNILNTGRGSVDDRGNLVVILEAGDTSMVEVPGAEQVQRSLIFDWTTVADLEVVGRHQVNFLLLALAGP